MATRPKYSPPVIPFPIFAHSPPPIRYLVYDISVLYWLRTTQHILGVLIGTLPQVPAQNLFLGLPLQLMPEEARLLAEKGLAFVVDNRKWHEEGFRDMTKGQIDGFHKLLEELGREAAMANQRRIFESREKGLAKARGEEGKRKGGKKKAKRKDSESPPSAEQKTSDSIADHEDPEEESELLFNPSPKPSAAPSDRKSPVVKIEPPTPSPNPTIPSTSLPPLSSLTPFPITLTTSIPPLLPPEPDASTPLPTVKPASYALFKHLHEHNYYLSPGLRFGCKFVAYPGDPLRYHSHFLAVGYDWDEEIDLIDIISGGRLGTGVKKGFLLGGEDAAGKVRTFCVEWGGM